MKKIFYALMILPLLSLWGCKDDEEIVFRHEEPQFELRSDAILLEVIVPYGTAADDAIYITGPAIGLDEETVLGNADWQLTRSSLNNKYGIYIDPVKLATGKTLADGYYFVSLKEGREMSLTGEEVLHNETAALGQRSENIWVRHWLSYFIPPEESVWPEIPGDRIQLRFNVPDHTPFGYQIGLVGELNGWSSTNEKFMTTAIDHTHYYVNLDPTDFSEGKSLADMFKVSILVPGQEWWYHESNEDGGAEGGAGFTLANTMVGRAYEIDVLNWRNSADLPQGIPAVTADKFMLMINVPDYTPENSLIGIFGNWTGWGAMLGDPAPWTFTMFSPTAYYLMIDYATVKDAIGDMFHVTLYYPEFTDGNWWKHQANSDGSGDEGAGINNPDNPASPKYTFEAGKTYNIDVVEWRNSDDVKGVDPEDLSVAPWSGLTVDADKILLQIEVPGYTPDNSSIALCGAVSGWAAGADNLDKFGATQYSSGRYYIMLDPNDFEAGITLGDGFKLCLLGGATVWDHENNADGTDASIPNLSIAGTTAGKAYTVVIPNWKNSTNIAGYIQYPPIPADKVVIHLFVPQDTPDDAVIGIHGDINNWGDMDAKWVASKINKTRYVLELDPDDFLPDTGLTKETTPNGFSFAIHRAGKDWYYFQSEGGNMLLPNGASVGNAYNVTVTEWKNAGEL